MLESFDAATGNFTWHCHNPNCHYHNCKHWEGFRTCVDHDTVTYVPISADTIKQVLLQKGHSVNLGDVQSILVPQATTDARTEGQTHQHHISHPEVQWTGKGVVALPTCDCGTRMFLKVEYTDEELQAPNIRIPVPHPVIPGAVVGFTQHPAVQRHMDMAAAMKAAGKTYTDPFAQGPAPSVANDASQQPTIAMPAVQPQPPQQLSLPNLFDISSLLNNNK